MAKRKTQQTIQATETTSGELLGQLRDVASLREIETATGIDRGTLSKLIAGKLERTNESNYRALLRFAIEQGLTVEL